MFGYVRIRKPELLVKDYECYKGFYCGLCHSLRDNYGLRGQVTLTYDMTFLVLLLSSVYDLAVKEEHKSGTKTVDVAAFVLDDLAPKYAERNGNGGYTRIVKIGQRKGDAAMQVLIELV